MQSSGEAVGAHQKHFKHLNQPNHVQRGLQGNLLLFIHMLGIAHSLRAESLITKRKETNTEDAMAPAAIDFIMHFSTGMRYCRQLHSQKVEPRIEANYL
jgi:hypothetical protein